MTTKVSSNLINSIATSQLTGTITNAQLAGSITSDKISSVATTALTGTITNAQLAGSITSDKISSVATTALTGTITGAQLASGATVTNLGYTPPTNASAQITSLGVGTAASGTTGEIRATNEVTAYYSDDRLKTKLGTIENALDKLCTLEGFYYEANETAQALGYTVKREVGISAQSTQLVLPEIVKPAPIDEQYLTISYEKFAPLFVEAIKELRAEINEIKDKIK